MNSNKTLAKLGSGGLASGKLSVAEENEESSAEATVAKGRRKKKAKGIQKKPCWSEFILQLLRSRTSWFALVLSLMKQYGNLILMKREKKH